MHDTEQIKTYGRSIAEKSEIRVKIHLDASPIR